MTCEGVLFTDEDSEQLGLTAMLFDVALCELDTTVIFWALQHRTHQDILSAKKKISAGHWVDLEASWAVAHGNNLLLRASVLGKGGAQHDTDT